VYYVCSTLHVSAHMSQHQDLFKYKGTKRQKTNFVTSYFIAGRDSSVGIATRYGWTARGSNPGGGEIFRACPDPFWDPPSLLYNGHLVSFPWVKRPGRGLGHPPTPSIAEVKKKKINVHLPSLRMKVPDHVYVLGYSYTWHTLIKYNRYA
jgi:hypothetical protein